MIVTEYFQENLKSSARRLGLGCNWNFQQDNIPQNTLSGKVMAKSG